MRHSRDFRIDDLVIATSPYRVMRGRIGKIDSDFIYLNNGLPFPKDNVHRVKYKDQHTSMVYDRISDTKEEMMVSRETIEYLENMMNC